MPSTAATVTWGAVACNGCFPLEVPHQIYEVPDEGVRMVLDLRVKTDDPVATRVRTVLEQVVAPQTPSSYDTDTFFSDSFVRHHTEFDSFDEFCRASPCERDSIGAIQRLPADERDDFVARTTAFETWAEMKERSAVADLITLSTV
jgi:hypothetical protein